MRHAASLAAALAASLTLGGAALAQSQPSTSNNTQPKTQLSATSKAEADKTVTTRYVREAAISDMFEVQAGKLALVKARNNGIKDFARMMMKDHTESSNKIKDAIKTAKLNIKPPAKLDAEHQKMIDQLKNADTAQFDKIYMDQQVKGHNQALALHQKYASSGSVSELKSVANEIVRVVQHHLAEANKLASAASSNAPSSTNSITNLPRKGS